MGEYDYKIPHGLYFELRKFIENYNLYDHIDEIISEAIREKILSLTVDLRVN